MSGPDEATAAPSRRRLLHALGWAVTAASVGLAVYVLRDRWDEVRAVGGLPGVVPVLIAIAVNLGGNAVMVAAWREVVALAGPRLPFALAARVWSASQITRLAFAMAPVGARPVLARRHGVGLAVGAASTMVEIAWLVALSPVVALATLPWWAGDAPGWRWVALLGVIPAVWAVVFVVAPDTLLGWVRRLLSLRLVEPLVGADTLSAAADVHVGRAASGRLAARYVVNYGLRVAAYLAFFDALGGDLGADWAAAMGAFALGQFAGNLAIFVPGGIGPREGVTAVVLTPLIGAGPALVIVAATRLAELAAELLFLAGGQVALAFAGSADPPSG